MHTHSHTQIHIHTQHTYETHTWAQTHSYICLHAHRHSQIHTHATTHTQTHILTCKHTHIQTHTHAHMPTHTNTPIHIFFPARANTLSTSCGLTQQARAHTLADPPTRTHALTHAAGALVVSSAAAAVTSRSLGPLSGLCLITSCSCRSGL